MASAVGDEQPPAYESIIRGDRHVPDHVDTFEPKYESIIGTESYYVMPNPRVAPTSVERKSTQYHNVEDRTVYHVYAEIHVKERERDVHGSPSQEK